MAPHAGLVGDEAFPQVKLVIPHIFWGHIPGVKLRILEKECKTVYWRPNHCHFPHDFAALEEGNHSDSFFRIIDPNFHVNIIAISKVIIVGSGPAGLVLSLLLAKQGINVVILEAAEKLDEYPRATHYSFPATYELERAGVLQEVISEGFLPDGVSWRDIDGHALASISTTHLSTEKKIVCLPLNRLTRILIEHIAKQPTAEVKWSHKVLPTIGQDQSLAWVMVETPNGTKKISADYIVGCDGANSQIRKSLFGDLEFPGRTWDEQIVATNVYYDMTPYNWGDSSFILNKEHWFMLAKIQKDGLLRVTYGDIPGLTREEYIARQPMKFKSFLPGRPNPDQYKIVGISPYKVHQRCAKSFHQGRFLLVADAAHLCNPFGGLGLTGGLVDAGNLFDCLNGIHQGLASDDILSRYDVVRREMYNKIIDPVSSENIRRLWQDPAVAEKEDKFFEMCRMAEADPDISRKMQEGLNAIMHDFRKEYPVGSPASDSKEQKSNLLSSTTRIGVTAGDA